MNREQFLDLIFKFFKARDEDKELLKAYDLALSTKKQINWQGLYAHILQTTESRYLPAPKYFLEKMRNFEIVTRGSLDGHKVRAIFKSGKVIQYVVINDFKVNLARLREDFEKLDPIVRVELYPPEVTIIGQVIVPKDFEPKVLYENTVEWLNVLPILEKKKEETFRDNIS